MSEFIADMVSVIVPVFNAQCFLHKCIESILSQSYSYLNIILVDDGSEDASAEICDFYKVKDDRVFVIHKANGGLVSARKAGIEVARGEFTCWVDADDWVERDFIKDFVDIQKQAQADMVAMSLFHDIDVNSTIENNGLTDGEYSITQVLPKLMYTGKFYEYGICPHLVTKMFKTCIIREAELGVDERIVAGEDAAAVYSAILKCSKIAIKNKPNYHYIQHPSSITKIVSVNELQRLNYLWDYLLAVFKNRGVYDIMEKQLGVYRNYIFALRKIDYFDIESEKVLIPYGGISRKSKVIIYGAGVIGQMIYKYVANDNKLYVIKWIDMNYEYYRTIGYDVNNPEILEELDEEYDYILIASISEYTYISIRARLIELGIIDEKIRWFSEDFRYSIWEK